MFAPLSSILISVFILFFFSYLCLLISLLVWASTIRPWKSSSLLLKEKWDPWLHSILGWYVSSSILNFAAVIFSQVGMMLTCSCASFYYLNLCRAEMLMRWFCTLEKIHLVAHLNKVFEITLLCITSLVLGLEDVVTSALIISTVWLHL